VAARLRRLQVDAPAALVFTLKERAELPFVVNRAGTTAATARILGVGDGDGRVHTIKAEEIARVEYLGDQRPDRRG